MKWQVGVTTVPARKETTLPKTLASLRKVGFEDIRLFVDGCDFPNIYQGFNCPVTCRPSPPVRVVGNWMMGMWELYVREPLADRYAMFQDDVLCVGNLRQFLERSPYPNQGYLNLITHQQNAVFTHAQPGWQVSNQRGLGACALVFSRDALQIVLGSKHMACKPACASKHRSWKYLDGGILEAMRGAGWKEYIHNPSLIQHIGQVSSLDNQNKYLQPIASFPGETFDAIGLLK